MIVVIIGTNRQNSVSKKIAETYVPIFQKISDEEIHLVDLRDLESDLIHPEMYDGEKMSNKLKQIQDELLIPAKKWIMIVPEYNGTFPGILKLFIDAISVRKYNKTFKYKKLGLIGVASGRSGNGRGIDHLTTSMNYLGMTVCSHRLLLSETGKLFDLDDQATTELKELLYLQAGEFNLF